MKTSRLLILLTLLTLMGGVIGCRENRSDQIQKDLNKAYELMNAGENEKAVELLLEAESQLDETVSPRVKVSLYHALTGPYYNAYSGRGGRSKEYAKKAIAIARETDSLQWLPGLLWNLALNTTNVDSVSSLLSECRDLSDRYGNSVMSGRARRFLASIYFHYRDNQSEGERILDSLANKPDLDSDTHLEITMERATFYRAKGDYKSGIETLKSIGSKSLSLDGKISKYGSLYDMERESGNYESALIYRDSLALFQDSINKIKTTNKLSEIENQRNQALIREEGKRRLIWSIGGGVALLLIVTIFFLNRNRRMKARQVKLIEKISRLNLRLSELESEKSKEDSTDIVAALIEKFRLTKEFFFTLPESALIGQLNMAPNAEDIAKEKLKALTDSIIGNFSESCANLRQIAVAATPEDTLMCMLFFVGLHKDVVEVIMKTSDDALRKRKSRVKQKLPPELFDLFFSK